MDKAVLKLMTFNIRHGLGRNRVIKNCIFQNKRTVTRHLNEIADIQTRENPDIVALQEADKFSLLSGKFNHVEYLAGKAGYDNFIQGAHVNKSTRKVDIDLHYGTALLSRFAMQQTYSQIFDPAPPSPCKGFVRGIIEWPEGSGKSVEIVSLHLDFFRKKIRIRQSEEIIDYLSARSRPLIVMGDFNSEWSGRRSAPRFLCSELGLAAYEPESASATFRRNGKRLDWILISPEFKFLSYDTLDGAAVSDHKPVLASVGLR